MIALLLAACTGAPTEVEERAAAEAAAEALATEAGRSTGPQEAINGDTPPELVEAVQVVLVWDGIGPLHKGFFSDQELVTDLAVSYTHLTLPTTYTV